MPSAWSERRFDSLWVELARIGRLSWYERELAQVGFARVAGVDEAAPLGRGEITTALNSSQPLGI